MKDITTNLFKVKGYRSRPSCGGLLIAEPFAKDTFFNHGVVSIIDYIPEEGATGVVLNNRTQYTLCELLDGVDSSLDIPVYCGGPVGQDRLYFIHTLGSDIIPGARQYAPGLYVGGDFDAATQYINENYDTEGYIRFFIGYSSWCEGQLERELEREEWALGASPSDHRDILCLSGDSYWHRAVRRLGEKYRSWTLMPRNVSYN